MKDTIYTIPLTDAFKANDECPFCYIKRKLEQDAISFILGCAYMEDDIRAETDKMGFCSHHYKKMYEYGNRLGTALILHTHYVALRKELKKHLDDFSPTHVSVLDRLKKRKLSDESKTSSLSSWLKSQSNSCYICNSIEQNYSRYIDTFFHLIKTNNEFYELYKKGKGFCLPHFHDILDQAESKLSNTQKESFYSTLFSQMEDNLKRIEEDLSWFIDKFDYKNKHADWKNSQDAIPRGIQKLASIYVQDEPFKEK